MATTDRLLYISSDGLVRQLGFDPTAADLGGAAGVASSTHAATSKTTPVDADEIPMSDSADSWGLKKLTWANLKATLKTYFDTLYQAAATYVTPTTLNNGTLPASVTTLATSGNATLGDAEATDTHAIKGATTVLANSASPAVKVTQTGSGNAFVVEDSASTDSTPFVIDASGKVIVGHTAAIAGGYGDIAVFYELGALPRHFLQAYSADIYAPVVEFAKSRNAAIGSHTVVQANDELGAIRFSGSDGTAYKDSASIRAFVDGTPGTNDMPGRLVFSTTADGASSPTERMRIDSTGSIGFGGSPFTSTKFRLTGTHPSSAVSPIQTYSDPTFPATGITQPTNFYSAPSTASNAGVGYTVATLVHYLASQGAIHADSTVTTQSGFRVDGTLTGATTNYGFYSALAASGAARYNFYAAGDAPNRFAGETLVIGPAGLGYGTGAGGTVTQATSRTTGVTLNKPTGAITLVSAAGSTSWQSFTVTNSLVAATDVVRVSQKSGTDKYMMHVTNVAAGSFQITFATTGGTTTEQPVFNFAVIKGATS